MSFTVRVKVEPVPEFAEPVDCTPVSKPPALSEQGLSKVDSVGDVKRGKPNKDRETDVLRCVVLSAGS